MVDVKDKVKGFVKKANNPFSSSSSGKFKGQGRVLGSSSSGPVNPVLARPPQAYNPPASTSNPSSSPQNSIPGKNSSSSSGNQSSDQKTATGFDPYDSFIASGKKSQHGCAPNVFECPICGQAFTSEEKVSIHVNICADNSEKNNVSDETFSELNARVGVFLSGKPSEGSVEVVIKLFRNIVKEPGNLKFRKIRMSNPKIKEAIGEVLGGVELLEIVGFQLKEECGEMWAVMEVPSEEDIDSIKKALSLLESHKVENLAPMDPLEKPEITEPAEPKKPDRQVCVFFSVPESVAAKIALPDSFYNLTLDEVRREAQTRKKKIEDSQLLIPKSYREKQVKAGRKKYKRTVIRIQFPDGVVLQGVFSPRESTTALYEFVSSALKEPSLEFELLQPAGVRRRLIPRFPEAGEKVSTLDDEDLVPCALVKFRPIETDSIVFTGLCNELLEASEPLVNDSAVSPL